MNARNLFAITLSFVLVFTLTACNSSTLSYEAFLIDHSDSAADANYQAEQELCKTDQKTDPAVPQIATLTINNKTIEGTYTRSEKTFPDTFYSHLYQEKNTSSEFALDDSGKITWLCIPSKRLMLEIESKKELTKEACLEIAKNFILDTVSDKINLDEYTISETKGTSNSYAFEFRKHINGYATVDKASISVLKNGAVYLYKSTMFDRISAADMPELNQNKIVRTTKKKLDTIYADAKKDCASVVYEETEYYFLLLEDGKPAICCTVTVRLHYDGGLSRGAAVQLLIT